MFELLEKDKLESNKNITVPKQKIRQTAKQQKKIKNAE